MFKFCFVVVGGGGCVCVCVYMCVVFVWTFCWFRFGFVVVDVLGFFVFEPNVAPNIGFGFAFQTLIMIRFQRLTYRQLSSIHLKSRRSDVRIPLATGFGSNHTRDFKKMHSSGYPARRLAS